MTIRNEDTEVTEIKSGNGLILQRNKTVMFKFTNNSTDDGLTLSALFSLRENI